MLVYIQMLDAPRDKDKLKRIYSKYYAFMFNIADKILHNQQDSEDAVHNAFLSIIKNIEKIEDISSPKTRGYISIIAERKAIDVYRERKNLSEEELDGYKTGISFPPPEEHTLDGCISKLPPRYREVILLKYSHGYSVKEIAEILGISFAAASKLDQRAKKKLHELCEKEGIL